jgi:hypothetical protein
MTRLSRGELHRGWRFQKISIQVRHAIVHDEPVRHVRLERGCRREDHRDVAGVEEGGGGGHGGAVSGGGWNVGGAVPSLQASSPITSTKIAKMTVVFFMTLSSAILAQLYAGECRVRRP